MLRISAPDGRRSERAHNGRRVVGYSNRAPEPIGSLLSHSIHICKELTITVGCGCVGLIDHSITSPCLRLLRSELLLDLADHHGLGHGLIAHHGHCAWHGAAARPTY